MMQEQLGRFLFSMEFRNVGNDKGFTIRVLGPARSSGQREILRFDCFGKQPHYHVGFSTPPLPIDASDPLHWTIEKLRRELSQLLLHAGGPALNVDESDALSDVLVVIEKTANQESAKH